MDHKLADAPGSARSIARPEAGGSERLTRVPEAGQPMTRRRFLGAVGLGAGTVVVVGAGGLTWRAVDQGVFATGTGPVYAAWDAWNPPGHNPLDLVRAAVLAANAHNTQPWLFRVTPARIDLLAVRTGTSGRSTRSGGRCRSPWAAPWRTSCWPVRLTA
jgi:hypothetical protein